MTAMQYSSRHLTASAVRPAASQLSRRAPWYAAMESGQMVVCSDHLSSTTSRGCANVEGTAGAARKEPAQGACVRMGARGLGVAGAAR